MQYQHHHITLGGSWSIRQFWAVLAELWVVAIIVGFFVTRVLGSEMFHHRFHFLFGR